MTPNPEQLTSDSKSECHNAQLVDIPEDQEGIYLRGDMFCSQCGKVQTPARTSALEKELGPCECGIVGIHTIEKHHEENLAKHPDRGQLNPPSKLPEKTTRQMLNQFFAGKSISEIKEPNEKCEECLVNKAHVHPSKLPPPQSPMEWEKDLDEVWSDSADPTPNRKIRVKAFITRTVKEAYERGSRDERKKNIDTAFGVATATMEVQLEHEIKIARAAERKEIVEMVQKLVEASDNHPMWNRATKVSRCEALEDLIARLTEQEGLAEK